MVRTQKRFDHLEKKYEGHRERGKRLRGSKPRLAARHLLKAASFADQLAELEENARLEEKRHEVAVNLRKAAQEELEGSSVNDLDIVDPNDGSGDTDPTDRNGSANQHSSDTEDVQNDQSNGDTPDGGEYFEQPPDTDFDDIGGLDGVIRELKKQILQPLEHASMAEEIGVGATNGALLHGPPGTGKTLLVRAMAGELGYRFAEMKCSELGSKFVNEGAENIAALFEAARNHQPCVVFLDEIDSLAPDRTEGPTQTGSERKMVTELLQELERIQGSDIVVIAATNLIDDVDVAIRRSGRFDRTFYVDTPGQTARREIFKIHLEDLATDTESLDLDALVDATEGFTGADIEAAVDTAGRQALNDSIEEGDVRPITQTHLDQAVEKITPKTREWESATATGKPS